MSKGFQQGNHIMDMSYAEKSVTHAQIIKGKLNNIIYSINKFRFETLIETIGTGERQW